MIALSVLVSPSAISQAIPAEVREGFILLEKDIHDQIEMELDVLDSLRKENDRLRERIEALMSELGDKTTEINRIERDLSKNEQAIESQLYELKATIRLLKIEIRDQKVIMDKYAKRRLTANQKKALGLMGIMTLIVGTWITLDIASNN